MRNAAKVLIVDDSRVLRMHLRTMMQGMGWTCEEADSGVAALDKVRNGGETKLVLMDVNMPKMNGIECLRAVRERRELSGVKVLMVTTESDFPLITEALESGADEYLMKPFTRESLMGKLMLMGLPVGL